MGWADACRPHFWRRRSGVIRPGARGSLPARRSASRRRATGPAAAARPRLARGDAAPPRPRRARLHRPGGLPRLRHLPGLERGDGRGRLRDGPLLCGRRRRDRRTGRPRAGRHRTDPAAVPALAAVDRGGRGRRSPAACCSRSRRRPPASAPTACARASSTRLLPASRRRHRRGPLLGHDARSSSASARTSSPSCCSSPGLLLISGRSVSDMVRAGRRGFDRAKRGTVGFATAVKESRDPNRPGPDRHDPGRHRADLRPARADRGRDEDFQVLVGATSSEDREPVANFDEAVRVADEPDTSELEDLEDDEAIRLPSQPRPNGMPGSEAEDMRLDGEAVDRSPRRTALTPMGEKRGGVTESEEIDYELPVAEQVLERGAPDKGPDKQDHEAIGRNLLETLGHFGVEAKIVGIVTGPHVSRYELQARARAPRSRRSPSSRTTSPTRWPRPTSASWRRSPASRPSGSRSRTSGAAWSASATSTAGARRAPRRWSPGSARTSTAAPSGPTCRRCRTR